MKTMKRCYECEWYDDSKKIVSRLVGEIGHCVYHNIKSETNKMTFSCSNFESKWRILNDESE